MAKVKIQGNASGTGVLTVTAPNTSTDRTITLPDATGELLSTAGGTMTGNLNIGSYTANSNADNLVIQEAGDFTGITLASDNDQGSNIYFADPQDDNVGGITYNHSSNDMRFRINGSEKARFLSSGGITFNGDSSSANALDDYEEGSWTPTFTGSSGSAGSVAYNTQKGYYTKIGRLVSCQFTLDLTNAGSWTNEVRLTGLPFDPADTFPAAGSVSLHRVNVPNDASGHDVYVNPGVTYFRFYYTQDDGARTFVQAETCQDTAKFNGIISYIV